MEKVPESFRPMIAKCLEEDREKRYQNCREFEEDLESIRALTGETPSGFVLNPTIGRCIKCGTINDPDRKFCANPACKCSLVEPCVGCSAVLPNWENVCGECGVVQSDELARLKLLLVEALRVAEGCLENGDFAKGLDVLGEFVWKKGLELKFKDLNVRYVNVFNRINSKKQEYEIEFEKMNSKIHNMMSQKKWGEVLEFVRLNNRFEKEESVVHLVSVCKENIRLINDNIEKTKVFLDNSDVFPVFVCIRILKEKINKSSFDVFIDKIKKIVIKIIDEKINLFIKSEKFENAIAFCSEISRSGSEYEFIKMAIKDKFQIIEYSQNESENLKNEIEKQKKKNADMLIQKKYKEENTWIFISNKNVEIKTSTEKIREKISEGEINGLTQIRREIDIDFINVSESDFRKFLKKTEKIKKEKFNSLLKTNSIRIVYICIIAALLIAVVMKYFLYFSFFEMVGGMFGFVSLVFVVLFFIWKNMTK